MHQLCRKELPDRRILPKFTSEPTAVSTLPLYVERVSSTGQALHLFSTSTECRLRYTVVVDAHLQ